MILSLLQGIHVAARARLIFTSASDTLILDNNTVISGTGPILVAGTLI